MWNRFGRMVETISTHFQNFGVIVCLPILTALIALDVILRYIFNAPLVWAHEATGLLLLLVFLLSIIACWQQKKHIRMELLYERFPRRVRAFADGISAVTGMIVFGMLAIQVSREIPYVIQTRETMQDLPIPIWPFKAVIVLVSIGFFFVLMIGLVNLLKKPSR
jgi:TRAP-type transport system small permease protein